MIARRRDSALFTCSLSRSFGILGEELFSQPRLSETNDEGELRSGSSGDAFFVVLNPEPLPPPRLSEMDDEGELRSVL